ncbi:hypothetical protein B0G80_0394 [Paraburkholderia sp. BL6669N2]|uniref:hypothetical protein n=1 Tax=Paraburkholderia sp. BL6669N2 TaxID=1938807 RepID=UPI000E26D1E8|nr:hypothetical protein [Paraburkholderia sp. BL6669N2]REG57760.1 hypothetical protein B0G80_0394 [Paraburkholderia sp. BL6669N2]
MVGQRARRSELVSLKVTPDLKSWIYARAHEGYRTISVEAMRILEKEMLASEKENAPSVATGEALVTQ